MDTNQIAARMKGVLAQLAIAAGALALSPAPAGAEAGTTDVTVRGAAKAAEATGTLAQTGVGSDAWFFLAAGVILVISAIASMLVLRRERHASE
jgi:LPXTG-motif cell wall-anchored protein